MEWHENYCVGIEKIDKQHKRLFRQVGILKAALSSSSMNKEIGEALKFLVDYVRNHFADEEEVMLAMEFPGYENQKKLHGRFIREITEILLRLKRGQHIDPYHLIDFLTDWLLNHVKYEDKKIGRFFLEQN